MNTKVTIFGIVILIFLIVITVIFKVYNFWTFFGMIFYMLLFFTCYAWIIFDYNRRMAEYEELEGKKKTFKYCWERVNVLLKSMAGGDGLEWGGGFGRRTEVRSFHDGQVMKRYRSMVGYLSGQRQLAVVIYDIDNDDIAKYYANPSTQTILNPFYDFKPVAGRGETYGVDGFGIGNRYPYPGYRYPYMPHVNTPVDMGGQPGGFDSFPATIKENPQLVRQAVEKLEETSPEAQKKKKKFWW
jgi:hypothetical protein